MLFRLRAEDGTWCDLIAWLDRHGNGKHLWPYHPNKTLLDVRAGDIVIFRREQFRVLRLKPYRTSEAKDESQYSEITCGRDWEAGG
ncbi:MAG: hypothetical protein Fues2KO_11060 [Fuerstiella sp.]